MNALAASPALERSRVAPLSLSGAMTLFAIAAVLVTVSIPRLRGLAQRENEADARATAQLLAKGLADAMATGSSVPSLAALLREQALSGVRTDAELFPTDGVLRRHGYLFEIIQLPSRANAVRAWPWKHGSTGARAFLALCDGTSYEHANAAALWDGLPRVGEAFATLTGWR
jgi:hypothetical protein